MRVPLIRRGADETPIVWWEWLFAPLLMPVFFLALLIMAVASVPMELVYRLRQQGREKQLRRRLATAGRFRDWGEVEARLKVGEGTLLIEHRSPSGPIREWWTVDDVIAAAPVALPTSVKSLPAEDRRRALQDYARACSARYLDVEGGSACLTEVPVPLARRLDPAKYVVVNLGGGLMTAILLRTGRKLSEKYPQGKVVTLLAWSDDPLLFRGDAEAVFLAAAETGPAADAPGP